jgi:hypothetical protein
MPMHKRSADIRFGACPYLACNKFVKCKGAYLGWVRGVLVRLICHGFEICTFVNVVG